MSQLIAAPTFLAIIKLKMLRVLRSFPPSLWLMASVFAAYFAWRSLTRHWMFTSTSDLAFFSQACWLLGHGNLLAHSHLFQTSVLGNHFSLILLPIAMLYRLLPFPETLLVIQAVASASGAFPIYRLARHHLGEKTPALLCAIAYLLYPPLHHHTAADFHADVLAVPVLLWMLVAVEESNLRLLLPSLLLALSTKEIISVVTSFFGLLLLLKKGTRRAGGLIFGVSFVWFLLATQLFMPWLNQGKPSEPFVRTYGHLGQTMGQALWHVLSQPRLLFDTFVTPPGPRTLFHLFAPLLFMPLLKPAHALTVLLLCLINLLIPHDVTYHQAAPADALLPAAAVSGVGQILAMWRRKHPVERKLFRSLSVPFLLSALLAEVCLLFAISVTDWSAPPPAFAQRAAHLRQVVKSIPKDASVCATLFLLPHFSNRLYLFGFPAFEAPSKDRVHLYLGPSRDVPKPALGKIYFVVEKMETLPRAAKELLHLIRTDLARLKREPGIEVIREDDFVVVLRFQNRRP